MPEIDSHGVQQAPVAPLSVSTPRTFQELIDKATQEVALRLFSQKVKDIKALSTRLHKWTIGLKVAKFFSFFIIHSIPFAIGVYTKQKELRQELSRLSVDATRDANALRKMIPSERGDGSKATLFSSTEHFVAISQAVRSSSESLDEHVVAQSNILREQQEAYGTARTVAPFQGVSGTWTPYGFHPDASHTPVPEKMHPTSDRDLGGSHHLSSVLVHKDPTGRCDMITCGAIDRDSRGDELGALCKELQLQRVVIHQLQTAAPVLGEGKTIQREHEQAKRLNNRLGGQADSPHVAHTNNAMNAASDRLPSDQYNPEAYGCYLQWALAELPQPVLQGVRAVIALSIRPTPEHTRLNELLNKTPSDIKSLMPNPTLVHLLANAIQNSRYLVGGKGKKVWRIFSLLDQLTINNSLSQSSRVVLELALDRELEVTSVVNCKSGQDRTGHIRSLNSAVTRLTELGKLNPEERPEEYIDFLTHLDIYMEKLNTLEGSVQVEDGSTYESIQTHVDDQIKGLADKDPKEAEGVKLARQLKNLYFEEFQRVAIPLTAVSTGVAGLKYHQRAESIAFKANPHVLPFVPRFAQDTKGRLSQLTHPSSSGTVLTQEGLLCIQGLGQSRDT